MDTDYLPPAARGCGLEAVLHQLAMRLQGMQRTPPAPVTPQPTRRQVFAEAPTPD